MKLKDIMEELEALSNERTKKSHISQGAKEPVYGLTVKSMKPIAKKLLKLDSCQEIAYDLYSSGNYDLMYLAGMIVDPQVMDAKKFNEWIDLAYFYMIGDYIVAVSLSESKDAMTIVEPWINSHEDLKQSAGYSTYSWMLSRLSDDTFDEEKLSEMLDLIQKKISNSGNRCRYSMYYFLYNVGVSYLPLHKKALKISSEIGDIVIQQTNGKDKTYNAAKDILKQVDKNRLGFKRKYTRC